MGKILDEGTKKECTEARKRKREERIVKIVRKFQTKEKKKAKEEKHRNKTKRKEIN